MLLALVIATVLASSTSERESFVKCILKECKAEDSLKTCSKQCLKRKTTAYETCTKLCKGENCESKCKRLVQLLEQKKKQPTRQTTSNEVMSEGAKDTIRIGSFNIQVFGAKKMENRAVVDVLLKVLARYDIVLVQEIRDSSDSAIHALLAELKAKTGKQLSLSISERLGRTNSKEQYGYIYDSSKIRVVKDYQYEDAKDNFERAPYSVLIEVIASKKKMMLSGVHISPSKAVAEIDHLYDVYKFYEAKSDLKDIMKNNWIVMGDMNADCGYLSKSKWSQIRLRTDQSFNWLIKDGTDTTVATSVCAYDRFVTTHKVTPQWLKGVNVFNFGTEFKLDPAFVKKVSDHYPIELVIDTSA